MRLSVEPTLTNPGSIDGSGNLLLMGHGRVIMDLTSDKGLISWRGLFAVPGLSVWSLGLRQLFRHLHHSEPANMANMAKGHRAFAG